jgi:hypothetical protein
VSGRAAARSAVPTRSAATSGRAATTPPRGNVAASPRATPRTEPRAPSRVTPVRPELRLVPASAPQRARRRAMSAAGSRAPFVLLVVALLVGTTLGLLILNTAIAVDSLKATQLRAENAERAQEVQRLEQQVVTAGTPAEIAGAADDAGLVPAGPAGYLVLDPDGGATLRGIPQPAGETAEAPDGPRDGD